MMRSPRLLSVAASAALFMLALGAPAASEGQGPEATRAKSIFSAMAGYARGAEDGPGFVYMFKGSTFIGDSPFYYGFGSVSGYFPRSELASAETLAYLGWNDAVLAPSVGLDLCLGLIPAGSVIDLSAKSVRWEGPAIQPSIGLSLPYDSDLDLQLSIAPVIRLWDTETNSWGLSRSYFVAFASLRLKSYTEARKLPWAKTLERAE